MKRRICFLILLLFAGMQCLVAQNDAEPLWMELLEQWADQSDSETVPEDLVERLQDILDNPVNLNDTNSDAVSELVFLSDFQRMAIRAYIAQNGEMVSMNELYLLNGFDNTTLRLLQCFATVEPAAERKVPLKQLLRQGHSNVTVGGKETFPQSVGYQNGKYEGSPMRMYFRYYFKSSDRISFQLSGEKDAGESFAFGNVGGVLRYGFDYYSYHLMLNDFGRFRRVVVGKYQLQFGQGLTLWSGSAPFMSGAMPLRRYGAGIRPASAFCEYGYLRGAATTLSLLPQGKKESLDLTMFYSNVDRDATLAKDSANDAGTVFQSLSQTGLHRTESELKRKGQLNEQLLGGRLQFRSTRLLLGVTSFATVLSGEVIPLDRIYNRFAFNGKGNFNYGADVRYVWRRLELFGEVSASTGGVRRYGNGHPVWLPLAAVAGMQMQLGSDNLFSMAMHHASPNYHNLHANMIGQSSSANNEEGVLLYFKTRLPLYINMSSSIDYFRFPVMRYNIYSPSSGVDYRLNLDKYLGHNVNLALQYRHKDSQRNSDGQLYSVEAISRRQLQISLDYAPSQTWRFLSRIVYSWFDCEDHQSERGFLFFEDISWNGNVGSHPLAAGVRMSMFDVSDYDARIYSYERDLTYEYGVPMFIGRGLRCYAVCRFECTPRVVLSLKYGITYYPDLEIMGSGNDKIEGNRRQDVKLQLRWRF